MGPIIVTTTEEEEGEDIEEAGEVEGITTAIVAISLITVAVDHVIIIMAVGEEEVDDTTIQTLGIASIIIHLRKASIPKVPC